jgi:hypothetical protein
VRRAVLVLANRRPSLAGNKNDDDAVVAMLWSVWSARAVGRCLFAVPLFVDKGLFLPRLASFWRALSIGPYQMYIGPLGFIKSCTALMVPSCGRQGQSKGCKWALVFQKSHP